MNAILTLLRQTIGLDAAAVGASLIERAVRERMKARGFTREEDYVKLVKQSPVEWHLLVEAVVIIETWFFRDEQPFGALARMAVNDWAPAHPAGRLQLLSAPCSTGEEPYSMAMALLDAGLAPERFLIDAYDISSRALITAEQARYGRNSFRGKDLSFRDRHFQAAKEGFILDRNLRKQVRLCQGNLLDAECLNESGVYDIIFCRNLLIYLDAAMQRKILQKMRRLLKPSGALFVGAAELPLALNHGFISAQLPMSFACHPGRTMAKQSDARSAVGPALKRSRLRRLAGPAPRPAVAARKLPEKFSFPEGAPKPDAISANLEEAQMLADAGRLAEAAKICEAHLREHGVSAEAYYLLGLIRAAAGAHSQATDFYRRALYLKPDHYETLMQWASLSQRTGDSTRAKILQERAERAKTSENDGS